MDRVTAGIVARFQSEFELSALGDSEIFECFAGTMATQTVYDDTVSPLDIWVGKGGADLGIDTIAIIVNGTIVTDVDEIDELAEINKQLDVSFVLVQAERSSSFDCMKLGNFGQGVKDLFDEDSLLPFNDRVAACRSIINRIYLRSDAFRSGNPVCQLFYITTGKWVFDRNLEGRRRNIETALRNLSIFREVGVTCVDAEGLQKWYRQYQLGLSRDINMACRTEMPAMDGVEVAYTGLLAGTEFLKLVENEGNQMLSSVFYENVRHWQNWVDVNKDIRATLEDPARRQYFPLFNNGVTIVAGRIILGRNNKLTIENFQIVNGCQTSYVVHECRASVTDSVLVPIRLIATTNEEIRNAITKATNRQTEVSEEQMIALLDFSKKVEAYFVTNEGKKRLYFERRSRQYAGDDSVEKVRVTKVNALIRAFSAMFLERPHQTTRNYSALLKLVGKDVFGSDHKLEPYYTAAYALYRVESYFRKGILDSKYKPARYHLLLAFRMLVASDHVPRPNSNEMEKYCTKLLGVLWDDESCLKLFSKAVEVIAEVAQGNLNRDNIRTEPFTRKVVATIQRTAS